VNLRRLFNEGGVFFALLLVLLLFGLLIGPRFYAAANLELMARHAAVVCVVAFGMTMVIAAGGIDLSVGSLVALSTVVTALLLGQGASPAMALLGAVVVCGFCGTVNGLLITRLKVVPFIVTLGTMLLIRGAAKGLADERRVEAPMSWLNDLMRSASGGHAFLVPWGIWLTILIAVLMGVVLRYTVFGRHVFAIGSNERTARLCGVRVDRTKVAIYTVSAALAGLAGVMEFAKLSVGDPTVSVGLELSVIAAVIIGGGSLSGGRGTIAGTLAGAAMMTVIQVGCSQQGLQNWVQEIITGTIIVGAVALDHWRRRTAS
jgi:ribose/xylose/arabinose/galactoside ABC-type transport system permease subunit